MKKQIYKWSNVGVILFALILLSSCEKESQCLCTTQDQFFDRQGNRTSNEILRVEEDCDYANELQKNYPFIWTHSNGQISRSITIECN